MILIVVVGSCVVKTVIDETVVDGASVVVVVLSVVLGGTVLVTFGIFEDFDLEGAKLLAVVDGISVEVVTFIVV